MGGISQQAYSSSPPRPSLKARTSPPCMAPVSTFPQHHRSGRLRRCPIRHVTNSAHCIGPTAQGLILRRHSPLHGEGAGENAIYMDSMSVRISDASAAWKRRGQGPQPWLCYSDDLRSSFPRENRFLHFLFRERSHRTGPIGQGGLNGSLGPGAKGALLSWRQTDAAGLRLKT